MNRDKLAALADRIEERNTPPADWWRWATRAELEALDTTLSGGEAPRAADTIRRSCLLRHRLGLDPRAFEGCIGRRRNGGCRCGTIALERLTDAELGALRLIDAKARLKELARVDHIPVPRTKRWGLHKATRPKPGPRQEAPAVLPTAGAPPDLPALTETSTRPRLTPRFRRITRTPKWYDEPEPGAWRDRQF